MVFVLVSKDETLANSRKQHYSIGQIVPCIIPKLRDFDKGIGGVIIVLESIGRPFLRTRCGTGFDSDVGGGGNNQYSFQASRNREIWCSIFHDSVPHPPRPGSLQSHSTAVRTSESPWHTIWSALFPSPSNTPLWGFQSTMCRQVDQCTCGSQSDLQSFSLAARPNLDIKNVI